MGMYNYVHKSRVKETVLSILEDYYPNEITECADVGSISAVADYLDETNSLTAWEMRTADWPNMEGGEVFISWVEDGYLYSLQWTYVF